MASANWRTDTAIKDALSERACEFDFFQAVRLLARICPERKPIGELARPGEETVRFCSWLSLAFPASAVDAIEMAPDSKGPARMTITFLGLTGVQGVLPVHYTERLLERKAGKNEPLIRFFEIFEHRLASFFYRAWHKHHFPVLYETAALRGDAPDAFTRMLYAFIGMGTAGLRGRMRAGDESLLRYAGLLSQRPHSASALQSMLRDYFCVAVQIEQCVGSWCCIDPEDRAYLAPDEERNRLGVGAFLGDRVWDRQARIRICLGPLPLPRFRRFLPGAEEHDRLIELAQFVAGTALAIDLQLILRAQDVPALQLSGLGDTAPRLGWSTWLKTGEFQHDAGDAVFAHRN